MATKAAVKKRGDNRDESMHKLWDVCYPRVGT